MHPQIYHTILLVHKRTIYAQNVINSTTWELKMIECLNKTVKNMQPIFYRDISNVLNSRIKRLNFIGLLSVNQPSKIL